LNYGSFLVTALVSALRAPRPDIVVALTDPPVVGVIGLIAARRHRCPFVYVCQDVFPDVAVALGKVDARIIVALWNALNKLVRQGAERIVVIGRDMQDRLESQGVERAKLSFIPNWANDERAPKAAVELIREQFGWSDDFIVMHAGNLGLAQNLMIAVEAAQHLKNDPHIKIVFVGDGAARRSLQDAARRLQLGNVEFMPYTPKSEVHSLIAAADTHLISLAPGLYGCAVPSKIYGILAAGRPVIAAVDEGSEIDLILKEAHCGVRIDPGDVAALEGAIRVMRRAPVEELGHRGRELFEDRYERPRVTESYRMLLESLVDRGSA
jgi:glycosyltransferase involved in cell wall biosynthesis